MTGDQLVDARDMHMIHTMLRREFGSMAGLVRGVRDGDADRAAVVIAHIELISEVLHHHHGLEDKHIWPKLLDRLPDEIAPMVHKMESQHHGIEVLQTRLTEALHAWRGADPVARETAAEILDELVPLLGEHLAIEEDQVVPLINQCVTVTEWREMLADGSGGLAPESMPLIFGLLRYDADPEVFQATVDDLPAPMRPVILDLADQAFTENALRLHGTATPPHAGLSSSR